MTNALKIELQLKTNNKRILNCHLYIKTLKWQNKSAQIQTKTRNKTKTELKLIVVVINTNHNTNDKKHITTKK